MYGTQFNVLFGTKYEGETKVVFPSLQKQCLHEAKHHKLHPLCSKTGENAFKLELIIIEGSIGS